MKKLVMACVVLALFGPAVWAGVVVEMEVKETRSPDKSGRQTLYAQGEMTRTDYTSPSGREKESVIFRDQAMWFLNHSKKEGQKLDKEGMDQVSAQLNSVMKQLEGLPPQQRAMMEKMMKGKMPGMGKAPERRIEVGGTETVGDYRCTVHTLYSDDKKLWEVCSADEDAVQDVGEAMEAFQAMSRFAEELLKVVQQLPFAQMIETPFNEIDELGGFPIRTRTFDGRGRVERETLLTSITRKDVEPGTFDIPKGYKIKSIEDEMKKNR